MRYLILLLLNLPVILLALVNIITRYKLKKVERSRFRTQLILWLLLLVVLISSFPLYNHLTGKPPFDSSELSLFDIVQSTAIICLIYILNEYRRKIERSERLIRDLHQELSIKLSEWRHD